MTKLLITLIGGLTIAAAEPSPAQEKPENDFDYLLGDWEFTAANKQFGEFRGVWSALRLAEGQILDEYRVLDGKGGTIYVTTTLRNYNQRLHRWDLIGADAGTGLQDFGTAQRVGEEMRIEQRFGVGGPAPSLWRIRYYDIKPDRFSWAADRSPDDGKTWVEGYMRLEARRLGPSRSLDALTKPK
jgi:hypothetical protein